MWQPCRTRDTSLTVNEAAIYRRTDKNRNNIISVSRCPSTYEHMANPMSVAWANRSYGKQISPPPMRVKRSRLVSGDFSNNWSQPYCMAQFIHLNTACYASGDAGNEH